MDSRTRRTMLMPIRAAASSKIFFSAGARRTTTVSVRRRRSEPLRRPRLEPLITRLPEAIRTSTGATLSGAECTTSRARFDWRPSPAAFPEPETTHRPRSARRSDPAAPADDSPSGSACRAIFKPSFGPGLEPLGVPLPAPHSAPLREPITTTVPPAVAISRQHAAIIVRDHRQGGALARKSRHCAPLPCHSYIVTPDLAFHRPRNRAGAS